jgi:hypothetical protein
VGQTLGSIFSGTGAGANGAASTLQKVAQGGAAGAAQGVGKSFQQQPTQSQGIPGAPSATPVDASFFAPSTFNQPQGSGTNGNPAFYGR